MASDNVSRQELANGIRALAMDAVQRANSGHPGAPMGMAEIAEVLWRDYLRHDPSNPEWPDRDRFILSNGHGSMLIYALLHLTGYDLSMEDIKNFRQMHAKTPGHPEYGYTPGVETTTGPLGQGLANAVGMALAERTLGAQFNRPGHTLVDHWTYVFAGDGCLMEGVSHEACSLAGTWGLGKLVVFYDDNGISIDGKVDGWYTEDARKRFESYGWQVIGPIDGHDSDAIKKAIEEARADTSRPTLIDCKTIIGYGAPNVCGTHGVHGAPLGDDEIQATRDFLGWKHAPFEIPKEHYAAWDARPRGGELRKAWESEVEGYRRSAPEMAKEFDRRLAGKLPESWDRLVREGLENFGARTDKVATRKASEQALDYFGPYMPELLGGSADLSGSNNTKWKDCTAIGGAPSDHDGNYIHYGVREFGMTAIANGVSLHGGFTPYTGTFLVFSDYARNAIRMAALMRIRQVMVYTHDSIGLGEDGPTHQPVEHVASLRLIPNLEVWRPADALETLVAWQRGLERADGPVMLALSRQGLPSLERDAAQREAVIRGGYVLHECAGEPEAVVIATGSEVEIALEAAKASKRRVRVVSMPCAEAFAGQDAGYRDSVLPPGVPRVAVEAGSTGLWRGWVGDRGEVVGMDTFGESAPAPELYEHFGLTAKAVADAVDRVAG